MSLNFCRAQGWIHAEVKNYTRLTFAQIVSPLSFCAPSFSFRLPIFTVRVSTPGTGGLSAEILNLFVYFWAEPLGVSPKSHESALCMAHILELIKGEPPPCPRVGFRPTCPPPHREQPMRRQRD